MSPLRLFSAAKTQPPTAAASTVTTNGITITHGAPKLSKSPFGLAHKAPPALATTTTNAKTTTHLVPKGLQPKNRNGFFTLALSKMGTAMKTTVLPTLRVLLKNLWDVTCCLFGDFPDPHVAILHQMGHDASVLHGSPPVERPVALFKPDTFRLRPSAAGPPQQRLVNLAEPLRRSGKRVISPLPVNNAVAYFKEFEPKEPLHTRRRGKVTFELGPQVADFLTSDPPNVFSSLPTLPAPKKLLKLPTMMSLAKTPQWHEINFRCYEQLAKRVFESLESNASLLVDDMNSQLGALYRILKNEVLDKVKSNCLIEGDKVSHFTSTMAAIQAHTEGLFTELRCIKDMVQNRANPFLIRSKLNDCLRKADLLELHFRQSVRDLERNAKERRHECLDLLSQECKKLNKMVYRRHFELTESKPELEGSYVKVADRKPYRKTLAEIDRLVPDASEFHLPNQLKRAEKAASEASEFLRSVKEPAEKLYSLLQ